MAYDPALADGPGSWQMAYDPALADGLLVLSLCLNKGGLISPIDTDTESQELTGGLRDWCYFLLQFLLLPGLGFIAYWWARGLAARVY